MRGIGKHPNGQNKTTPLLIVANSGHYFLRFDEIIYDHATTKDKRQMRWKKGQCMGGVNAPLARQYLDCLNHLDPVLSDILATLKLGLMILY